MHRAVEQAGVEADVSILREPRDDRTRPMRNSFFHLKQRARFF